MLIADSSTDGEGTDIINHLSSHIDMLIADTPTYDEGTDIINHPSSRMDMFTSTYRELTDDINYYPSSHTMDSRQTLELTRIEVPEEVNRADLLAKCPLTLHANVTFVSCDHNGGVLTSKDGDLKITVPKGTVWRGDHITFCIVTNLYGPFFIPSQCQTDVMSPYYWIGVTGSYHFQKPVQVEFQHYAVVTACDPSHYQLLSCEDDDIFYTMQPVDYDLNFKVEGDILWCTFKTCHFCSYCLYHGCKDPKISRVTAIYLKTKDFQYLNHFTAEIWFSFPISYCIKRNEELYTKEGMILDQKCTHIFEVSCDESSTSYFTLIYHQDINGWRLEHSQSTRIDTKKINFYNCFVNMEELLANEKIAAFPERFIVNVTNKFECHMDLDTNLMVILQNKGETMESIPFKLFVPIPTAVRDTSKTQILLFIGDHQCNENKPELRELVKYSSKISTCWKELALHLGISEYTISVIDVNHSIDVNNKCYEMFNTWLQSSISPCWCHFAQALNTVGLNGIAEEVVTVHMKQHSDSVNVAASSTVSINLVGNEDTHGQTQTPSDNQCRIL